MKYFIYLAIVMTSMHTYAGNGLIKPFLGLCRQEKWTLDINDKNLNQIGETSIILLEFVHNYQMWLILKKDV